MLIQWQCICHSAAGDYSLCTIISELIWTADHSRPLGVMNYSLQIQASPLLVMLCAGVTNISLWPVVQEITDDIDNWSRPAITRKSRTILVWLIDPTFHSHIGNEKLGLSARFKSISQIILRSRDDAVDEDYQEDQGSWRSGPRCVHQRATYIRTYVPCHTEHL